MKRILLLPLAFMIAMSCLLAGCQKEDLAKNGSQSLTIEEITTLSVKGDSLSWNDFKKYSCSEVGSGLYILQYPTDSHYHLLIGGNDMSKKPLYIHIVDNESGDFIDIRHEDVASFLEIH